MISRSDAHALTWWLAFCLIATAAIYFHIGGH